MAASAARLLTARIPPMAEALELYASLVATTWPLVERRLKRNFPVGPFFTTNLPATGHPPSRLLTPRVLTAWHGKHGWSDRDPRPAVRDTKPAPSPRGY